MHKSQRYDEIGQWRAWELTRSISHGLTLFASTEFAETVSHIAD